MSKQLRKIWVYVLPLIAAGLTFGIVYRFSPYDIMQDAYVNKFRLPLFTGFLTLGGFFLSATAFIVVRMHDGVYNKENYKERVKNIQVLNPSFSMYKSLTRLTRFLLTCVVTALSTAFAQFTIGLIHSKIAVTTCWSLAAGAAALALIACWVIYGNLLFLFEFQEGDNKATKQA